MNTIQTEYSRTNNPDIVDAIILPDEFDIVKFLKVFGMEFWHFLLLNVVTAAWLPRLVGPLATIVTGERFPSSIWTHVSTALVLLCYGFFIGKSAKGYRITRVLLQCAFYAVCTILVVAVTSPSLYDIGITIAETVGSIAAGALIGCFFVSNKVEPEAKEIEFKDAVFIGVRFFVGFAAAIGALYLLMSLGTMAQSTLYVDKPAPKTSFATASGESWTFDDHKGKVILVEFWAPYCAPCVASFPELKRTYEHYSQHEDFEMVSVTSASMQESASAMFEKKQAPWTLLFRPDEDSPDDLVPYSIPAAYIIDRDGKVVAAHIRGAAVERELKKLFNE